MKKRIACVLMATAMLLTACQNPLQDSNTVKQLQEEVTEVLQSASYENLEILIDDIKYLEGQDLAVTKWSRYKIEEEYPMEELVKLYVEEVFPDLLGLENLDTSLVVDITSQAEDENGERYYTKKYEDVLASIDEYEEVPDLYYANEETCSEIGYVVNWFGGAYVSQGVLGSYANTTGVFGALDLLEEVKTYDCRIDDLSDSYMLIDGEKTVAEAKEEAEAYYNEHYPIGGRKNGIENAIVEISAAKISGTEYYAFSFCRTLSYNGIPLREGDEYVAGELVFMAEGVLCESNKVDVTIGTINDYKEPEYVRSIKDCIPFSEIMERVAYYLTGETKFQLIYGGLEYRGIDDSKGEEGLYMTPYWCFLVQNPNDDKVIKLYVDMETGEITGVEE